MAAHDRLKQWWDETGGMEIEQVSEERLAGLEKRYGITLPPEFRDYLQHAAPHGQLAWDGHTDWWSFERLRSVQEEECENDADAFLAGRADQWLLFADFMIWCWAWAIDCGDGPTRGKIAVVGDRRRDRIVAESFTDFVEQYVIDHWNVC
jgi:hypothetical protein